MLDLNINDDCHDFTHLQQSPEQHLIPSQTQTESATSSSSIIVNATSASDEDSVSATASRTVPVPSTLFFDILNTDHHHHHQTPVPDSGNIIFPSLSQTDAVVVPHPPWLNLSSFVDSVSLNRSSSSSSELWSLHQQQSQHKPAAKKSRRGPRSRSSPYRGVTFYRRTGRWESHIWDCGKQVYLGGFDTAHTAARAYDRAAIKFRGVEADINFDLNDYDQDMKRMSGLSKEEFVHALRRQSTGFARSSSKFRGVILQQTYGRPESISGPALTKILSEGEAVVNIDASNYSRYIQTSSVDGALDLSLSVTPASNGGCQVDSDIIRISGSSGYSKFGGQRNMFDSSASSVLRGQPSPPVWQFTQPSGSGRVSFSKLVTIALFAQSPTMGRRMVVAKNPSTGFRDWSFEVPVGHAGNVSTASMQPLPSAASSGFSSCFKPIAPPTHASAPRSFKPSTNAVYYNYRD